MGKSARGLLSAESLASPTEEMPQKTLMANQGKARMENIVCSFSFLMFYAASA